MRVKRSGWPWGWEMLGPRAEQDLQMPSSSRGGSAQLELTDALPRFHNTKLPHFFHSFRSKS